MDIKWADRSVVVVAMVTQLLLLLLLPDHPPLHLRHPRGVAALQVDGAVVRGRGRRVGRGGVLLPPEAAEGGRRGGPLGPGHNWQQLVTPGNAQGRGRGGELAPTLLGADAVVDDPARRGQLHPVPGDGGGHDGGGGGGRADGGRRGGHRGAERLSVARGNAQRAAIQCGIRLT